LHPYPFNLCYCSICRKTAGGGGFAINLSGDFETLDFEGAEHIGVYQVRTLKNGEAESSLSPAQRSFCKHCASALWVWDPRWPELVHPFASAIDTPLPVPPEWTHLMLDSKANWVEPCLRENDKTFDQFPDESIAQWHQRLGL
jgi:hypothetical protein